jgi:hypothetical protein
MTMLISGDSIGVVVHYFVVQYFLAGKFSSRHMEQHRLRELMLWHIYLYAILALGHAYT